METKYKLDGKTLTALVPMFSCYSAKSLRQFALPQKI